MTKVTSPRAWLKKGYLMDFRINVENVPPISNKWIVVRYDENTRKLWFWGSWDNLGSAIDIAKEVNGLVVERIN